jgi:hypothetical protein
MADTAARVNEASAKAESSLEEELQKVVGSDSFARLLAQSMGTTMGAVKLWNDGLELAMRSMRLPTQGELTRIASQVARLEDKLEDLLIAVERLEEQAARSSENGATRRPPRRRT